MYLTKRQTDHLFGLIRSKYENRNYAELLERYVEMIMAQRFLEQNPLAQVQREIAQREKTIGEALKYFKSCGIE